MLSTAQVEDLFITKVTALDVFKLIQSTGRGDVEEDAKNVLKKPAALVYFAGDENTGHKPRLVTDETYGIAVVGNNLKSEKDAARSVYDLIDAVRDGLHGKYWGYDELGPVSYEGRNLILYESGTIAYLLKFTVRHSLHVPVPY